jgi:hypothetical protein
MYAGLPHAFYIHPGLSATTEYFHTMVDWIENLQTGGKHERQSN